MSQKKHTPGPWSYWCGYNHMDRIEAEVTAEGGDIVIASYNHLIEEGEANAILIASAPDLLEALQAIIGACDRCEKDDNTSLIDEFTDEIESKARAAIARAKGQ